MHKVFDLYLVLGGVDILYIVFMFCSTNDCSHDFIYTYHSTNDCSHDFIYTYHSTNDCSHDSI